MELAATDWKVASQSFENFQQTQQLEKVQLIGSQQTTDWRVGNNLA